MTVPGAGASSRPSLLVMGVPIFVVLMAATLGGILLSINPVQAIHSAMFGSLDIFPLLAVPLFIYAGDIMSRGGIARRLIELILSIGRRRPRLARARHHRRLRGVRRDVGIERRLRRGDRQADHSVAEEERLRRHVLGQPGHRDRRHRRDHPAVDPDDHLRHRRAAVGAATVPRRLRAGHPDRHCARGLCLLLRAAQRTSRSRARPDWPQRSGTSLKDSIWSMFAPVVIFGGIYGGLFTPTEAAGVACIYAIVVSMFIYREMTWRELWAITVESATAERAGPHHRLGRRRVRLADHHQRLSRASSSRSSKACSCRPGCCCW